MTRTLSATIVISFALAQGASAIEVSESVDVKAPPQKAWAMIGEFCSIEDWHPVIAKCEMQEQDGDTLRKLTTGDGAKLLEQRLMASEEDMSYTYTILESPLPVSDYESTLSVRASDSGKGATVEWRGDFDAAKGASDAKAKKVISGIYRAGLDNVKKKLSEH